MDSRSVLKKVITDFVVLSAVALPLLVFRLFGTPPVRGFFCNDETIRYPFKDSTVPNIALYFVGLGLPIIVMCVTEIILAHQSTEPTTPVYLFGMRKPLWLVKSYEMVGIFCFGAVCSQMITDVGKYTIGRLRPHFFDVCDPSVDCSLSMYQYQYITDYTCRGSSSKKLREARLSFPSGHSSFSAYTMVYLAFYIQSRIHWNGSVILKHAAQLCCVLISWATALSRINDNKHHWSDVTVGLIIGTATAVVTATFLSTLFPAKNKIDSLEMTAKSSSSHQSMIDDKSRPAIEI
uniref:Phosphatidic acid phosphatase type 2/haloperoxidase domain-containing protein n=1 Tax=Lygus hesperus TaxID=30085 RepID=A0A0K8S456_LYGHE